MDHSELFSTTSTTARYASPAAISADPRFFAEFAALRGDPELRSDGYLGDQLVPARRFSADRGRDRLALAFDTGAC